MEERGREAGAAGALVDGAQGDAEDEVRGEYRAAGVWGRQGERGRRSDDRRHDEHAGEEEENAVDRTDLQPGLGGHVGALDATGAQGGEGHRKQERERKPDAEADARRATVADDSAE